MKWEYVRNGPFCSSPIQLLFNFRSPPIFFKRAPVVRIERGNFFLTHTVHMYNGYIVCIFLYIISDYIISDCIISDYIISDYIISDYI